MGDEVTYDVLGGALIRNLFVKGDLEKIFAFRERTLLERFGYKDRDVIQKALDKQLG